MRRWMTLALGLALAVAGCEEGPPPDAAPPGQPAARVDAGPPPEQRPPEQMPREQMPPEQRPPDEMPPEQMPPEQRPPEELPPERPFVPAPPVMARLTARQHRNTLEDLFGPGLPATPVEADTNPFLFHSIGAATTDVSAGGVEQYAAAAFAVAAAVFHDPERLARVLLCRPIAAADACTRDFIETMGRRVFRRPLAEEEVERWLGVARATGVGDALFGAENALAGLLQSPSFLYRVETGEPAPAPDDLDRRRYTPYEMASRLAFLLTDSAPDEALLDAAERGELLDPTTLAAQADRLLALPRARDAVQDFFAQYLHLPRLAPVQRDPAVYPGFDAQLLWAMETEVRLLVDDLVFRRHGDLRGLFSAPRAYVNRDLAALYGVDVPEATPTAFVPITFGPEVPRAGVLGLGAFLTMNAHPTETSPTLRGKYVRERVLCQTVPPPPGDVDLDLTPTEDDPPTLRERLEQHRSSPACAGCHAFIDPPGFLFEHFDSIGRYRTEVDGFPVDATGDFDGTPLHDSVDLAAMLRHDARVGRCIAQQLYRHATSRLDTLDEQAVIDELADSMAEEGYTFDGLMRALVLSEGFRTLSPPDETPLAMEEE
ncbi:MAG: DUF1592 domain-containing protein [Myxococcales bacterium]|nr:DUF1592 domain-containing protein [Myxococcales bacterium]